MADALTFSAAVDNVVSRSGRPEKRQDIVSYARASIREIQTLKNFVRDLVEDQITATTDSPFTWTRPDKLRFMRTVRYRPGNNQVESIWPKFLMPGKVQKDVDYYYYGGPTYFVFVGVSKDQEIDIAYYTYARTFVYYEDESNRPATYDLSTLSWSYLTASTDEEKEAARNEVTNWVLFHWPHVVEEGALAKVFKSIGDPKATSAFALYKSMQQDVLEAESFESFGF